MKKHISILLILCLLLAPLAALAEGITVNRRDLSQNKELDSSVSNILVLLQNGDVTDTLMIASINSDTGRAVMTRVDCALEVEVRDAGTYPIGEVYALGDKNSKGPLAMRTVNEWLELNIAKYVALDVTVMPELVGNVGALNMDLDAAEAEAMGLREGRNQLTGEQAIEFVLLELEDDSPARSRGYDALMQLLYQVLNDGGIMSKGSAAVSLLGAMDTNLNIFEGFAFVGSVQGGDDRRELALPGELAEDDEMPDAQAMRDAFYREVYE